MRTTTAASLLLLVLLPLAIVPVPVASPAVASPATPGDDAATLKGQVLDPLFLEKTRVKSAQSLVKADAEALGSALLELGEKQKNPVNLPFLVSYVVLEEARHLRLLATWAAWSSAPDKAAAAFLDRAAAAEDEREACRGIEAAGFIVAATKDRTLWYRFAEVAKGNRAQAGIEAARALNRTMDKRAQKDIVDAACNALDNHVRKHLVWAVLDLEGGEKPVARIFEGLRGRTGDYGKNASECAQIVLDKQANPFEWRADAMKEFPAWWKTGRTKNLQPDIAIKDDETRTKINGWLDEMKKEVPAWEHYVRSALPKIAYRADKDFEVFNLKKMTMNIETSVILRCESPWQGEYVLAQAAGIAFSAQVGEPSRDHRGWEPSYVDLYSFMKTTKHPPGKFAEFMDGVLAKKAWP